MYFSFCCAEPEKSTDKISGVVGDGAALPPSKRRKDDDTNTDESVEGKNEAQHTTKHILWCCRHY